MGEIGFVYFVTVFSCIEVYRALKSEETVGNYYGQQSAFKSIIYLEHPKLEMVFIFLLPSINGTLPPSPRKFCKV